MSKAETKTRRFEVEIYVAYDGPYGNKGKVLSRHRSLEAAEKAAKKYKGGFIGMRCIED